MGIFLFIVAILALAAGVSCVVAARYARSSGAVRMSGVGLIVLGLVFGLLSMLSKVDARSIGIETSAGKYVGTLHGGYHITAPWAHVEQWTTRNQTLRFEGTTDTGDNENYVTQPQVGVRLGNQSIAYVEVTISWTVGDDEKGIEGLWKQYRGFDDMRHDFVRATVMGSVNTAFDGYDPFSALNAQNADNPYVPLSEWSAKIKANLAPLLDARGIKLLNVQATQVHYDAETERKLRDYANAVANTRIAGQDAETAKKNAEATAARNDRTKIVPGCEALIRDLAAADQLKNLPAGWQCPGNPGPSVVSAK